MPILVAILGLLFPRLIIVGLWLLTDWFSRAFDSVIWPLLGFIFMPYTLLWYSAVQNWYNGTWGILQVIVLIVAIVADLSSSRGIL